MSEIRSNIDSKGTNLSPSVEGARASFPADEQVNALELVNAILDQYNHRSEYAGGKATSLSLDGSSFPGAKRTVTEWLEQVRLLYDTNKAQELHGRLVIIGLSLLEPRLRRLLQRDGFLKALEQELTEPLDQLLTTEGWARRLPADSVPTQPDDPLQNIDQDQLGRAAFARFLARRIRAVPDEHEGAYSIHLYGPWGAGKSTLLNFLRAELCRHGTQEGADSHPAQQAPMETNKQKHVCDWIVVEFNAWRHQHVQPPWWALMEQVFRESRDKLSRTDRFREYWWRLSSGRLVFLVGITLLAWLGAIILPVILPTIPEETPVLSYLAGVADNIGAILALLVTIWAGIQVASKPFLLGSAQAAQSYIEFTSDPMNAIKNRFNDLIARIPKPVAIFIDDLDRCQSTYVVDLLEGIQTLFRDASVVFVVAADRRWLNACYEDVYDKLEPLVYEPGKPLGTLFLEKAFQFSTSVPGMPSELQKQYWRTLLEVQGDEIMPQLEAARRDAKNLVADGKSEAEIMNVVAGSHGRPFLEQQAIREEAVKRLAAPEVLQRTEHVLRPLVPLLEPNPRAMKRLVNAYSANRALATLAYVEIERDQLALWTILSLRWPMLADYLADHPEAVERIGQERSPEVDERIRGLFGRPEVVKVVNGDTEHIEAVLDAEAVQQCAQLYS